MRAFIIKTEEDTYLIDAVKYTKEGAIALVTKDVTTYVEVQEVSLSPGFIISLTNREEV